MVSLQLMKVELCFKTWRLRDCTLTCICHRAGICQDDYHDTANEQLRHLLKVQARNAAHLEKESPDRYPKWVPFSWIQVLIMHNWPKPLLVTYLYLLCISMLECFPGFLSSMVISNLLRPLPLNFAELIWNSFQHLFSGCSSSWQQVVSSPKLIKDLPAKFGTVLAWD